MSDETKNLYQDTLNLPRTDFSLRANAAIREPELIAQWDRDGINDAVSIIKPNKDKFVLLSPSETASI